MRVIVVTHHHFNIVPDGTVYPYAGHDYTFFRRYLCVFDEVLVFARLKNVSELDPANLLPRASGPGVTFFPVPDFLGAWQYVKNYTKLVVAAKEVLKGNSACILRIPSHLCTILWRELVKARRPYGVEMVTDPWEALSPGSHTSILRPIVRRKWTRDTMRQCLYASTAAYVTEHMLQERCPPGGWSTHYSSVELPDEVIIDRAALQRRLESIKLKAKNNGPWRLCFAGSLWTLYKAPDILIAAVANCVRKGINVELTIIGGGSLKQRLEKQAWLEGIADRTVFLGQLLPGRAIYDQLDQADLYVLPSRSEGLPRSIIEAMARGLPCIGSNVGGFLELLAPEDTVEPGRAQNLQLKLSR